MGFVATVVAAESPTRPRLRESQETGSATPLAIPLPANEVSVRGLIIMIHADTNPGRLKVFESQYKG